MKNTLSTAMRLHERRQFPAARAAYLQAIDAAKTPQQLISIAEAAEHMATPGGIGDFGGSTKLEGKVVIAALNKALQLSPTTEELFRITDVATLGESDMVPRALLDGHFFLGMKLSGIAASAAKQLVNS